MTIEKSYIAIDATDLPALAAVLQKGFLTEIDTGCSVRELLCTQWKLSEEYVDQRISTLFIDGKPLDDLDAAVVEEGATLALHGKGIQQKGRFYRRPRQAAALFQTRGAGPA